MPMKPRRPCRYPGLLLDERTLFVYNLSGIITEKMCIQLLKPHKLKNQYTFKTGQAIATLEFRDIIRNWQ